MYPTLCYAQKNISCQDIRLKLPPIQENSTSSNLTLIAKLISFKTIGLSVVKEVTTRAWKTTYPVEVKLLNQNTFFFSFKHKADLLKVFLKRPWPIRGGHLILKKWSSDLTWQEIDFSTSALLVQVQGLLSLWQFEANLKLIDSRIGSVLEVDLAGEGGGAWKKFIRLKVDIPISNPLLLGFYLPKPNRNDLWI